jgi:hypothetical protein
MGAILSSGTKTLSNKNAMALGYIASEIGQGIMFRCSTSHNGTIQTEDGIVLGHVAQRMHRGVWHYDWQVRYRTCLRNTWLERGTAISIQVAAVDLMTAMFRLRARRVSERVAGFELKAE